MVFLGVVGEGLEIFANFKFKHIPHRFTKVLEVFGFISWGFVAVGLGIEFKEALDAERQIANLEKANLTLRSNVVSLEMAIESRRLTGKQRDTLTKHLLDFPSAIAIVSSLMDSESADFSDDLETSFRAAKWDTMRVKNFTAESRGGNWFGLFVGTLEGTKLENIRIVLAALEAAGIPHEQRNILEQFRMASSPAFQSNILYIVVGHKPPIKTSRPQ